MGWWHARAGRGVRSCAPLVVAALLVASCAGERGAADAPSESDDVLVLESRMSSHPTTWETGPVSDSATLEFTDEHYRMTAGGWPLLSPSMDERAVDLDPVSVEATFEPVSGEGLYGVACAVTSEASYVFVVGRQESGQPYYAIAMLTQDGTAEVLRDSGAPGSLDPAQVVSRARTAPIEGRCRSGDEPGAAVLELLVGGEPVIAAEVFHGEPEGQVGLVALSRSADELVVDVEDVTIRSAR